MFTVTVDVLFLFFVTSGFENNYSFDLHKMLWQRGPDMIVCFELALLYFLRVPPCSMSNR